MILLFQHLRIRHLKFVLVKFVFVKLCIDWQGVNFPQLIAHYEYNIIQIHLNGNIRTYYIYLENCTLNRCAMQFSCRLKNMR